jgi:hypothetical protein
VNRDAKEPLRINVGSLEKLVGGIVEQEGTEERHSVFSVFFVDSFKVGTGND